MSNRAGELLETLGYPEERIELAKIAGYMHDIGNCVNRVDHAHTGAILAYEILKDMGMESSGLDLLIKAAYSLLGLETYLTAGEIEVRAWTIKKGTKAPQAAGVIHSDFEKGFIKAEIVSYDDLMHAGSFAKARENGKLRLEGKEYVVKDGDVVHFRFNV